MYVAFTNELTCPSSALYTLEEMSVVEPESNPETVEVLLDTTWRVAAAESGRTEALDRKAATVASFAAVVATLTATLGVPLVEQEPGWWTSVPFVTGLAALVGAVGLSLQALRPKEHVGLAMEYLRTFPTWSQILKRPSKCAGRRCAV